MSSPERIGTENGSATVFRFHLKGPVNYLTYGSQKLVRYELNTEISQELGMMEYGQLYDCDRLTLLIPTTQPWITGRVVLHPSYLSVQTFPGSGHYRR